MPRKSCRKRAKPRKSCRKQRKSTRKSCRKRAKSGCRKRAACKKNTNLPALKNPEICMATLKSCVANSVQFRATKLRANIGQREMCDAIASGGGRGMSVSHFVADDHVIIQVNNIQKFRIPCRDYATCPKGDHAIFMWFHDGDGLNEGEHLWVKITPTSAVVIKAEYDGEFTINDSGELTPSITPIGVCDILSGTCGVPAAVL